MPDHRITDFRPAITDGAHSPQATTVAPARPASPRTRNPALPEDLPERAPQPYSSGALNRAHTRTDLGAKLNAFSQRIRTLQADGDATSQAGRRDTAPPPLYVINNNPRPTQSPPSDENATAQPLYVLDHATRPAQASTSDANAATEPLYVLDHATRPAQASTSDANDTTEPLYVLDHAWRPVQASTSDANATTEPLYVLNHTTRPAQASPSEANTTTPSATHAETTQASSSTKHPEPQPHYVLNHKPQTPLESHFNANSIPQPPYVFTHSPYPAYTGTYAQVFGQNNRNDFFAGRVTNFLAGLPSRFLPHRRQLRIGQAPHGGD
jgi:hypothetical protein